MMKRRSFLVTFMLVLITFCFVFLVGIVFADQLAPAVKEATEITEKRVIPQEEWNAPTSAPEIKPQRILYIVDNAENPISSYWAKCAENICKDIGWELININCEGQVSKNIKAVNQAVALKVDGIIMEPNAEGVQSAVKNAKEAGIPIVGIHAAGLPGPIPELGLYYNCSGDPREIGEALAQFVVAKTKGKGKVIILYDAMYQICRYKKDGMTKILDECPDMTLLEVSNTPLAEVANLMPKRSSSWLQKYEGPFYVITIADYYYDFLVPSLRQGEVPKGEILLVGSDGTESAYERIHNNEYQIATIPEPGELLIYQAIDELNRAMQGQDPLIWNPPLFIVTQGNIDLEGGENANYIPSYGYKEHFEKIWGLK